MSVRDNQIINENTDAGIARVLAMLGTAEGSESILEILGQTADTGGSATAGTAMAKLNALFSNHQCIRHIQRGVGATPANSSVTTIDITLSGFTNSQKMVAIINGNAHSGSGSYDDVRVTELTETNLRIQRYGYSGGLLRADFSYQVIEFY